jgi:hypothetical protein
VGLASMMHQYWLQKALTPESFRPAGNPAPRRDLTAPSTSSDSPSSPWSPPDI